MFDAAELAARHDLRRKGDRWIGQCPECGGSSRTDKFNLRDDGGFKCYACDFKGDLITYLRQIDGLNCAQAHSACGKRCEISSSCPAAGKCPHGDGSAKSATPTATSVPAAKAARTLNPREARPPLELWQDWAASFVAKAATEIRQQPEALAYLASRGIDATAVKTFHLGWHQHSKNIERSSLGLPPAEKPTVWLPAGIVIPYLDGQQIARVKIRRTDDDRNRFAEKLKYPEIQGGGSAPLLISRENPRGLVIVEAELDAVAVAAAHPQVSVLALGTVGASPSAEQLPQVQAAPVILVALDADPGTIDQPGPGPAAIRAWCRSYSSARPWLVPAGKDPGDYVKDHQGDLHTWIEAGLPPQVKPAAAKNQQNADPRPPLIASKRGGGGADIYNGQLPPHTKGKTINGYDYVIAHSATDAPLLRQNYPCPVLTREQLAEFKGMDKADAEKMLWGVALAGVPESIKTVPL